MVVRYKHDWQGQHLIRRKVLPGRIAWARDKGASRATGAKLSYFARTESGHHLIRRVPTGIRAGMVSPIALSRLQ